MWTFHRHSCLPWQGPWHGADCEGCTLRKSARNGGSAHNMQSSTDSGLHSTAVRNIKKYCVKVAVHWRPQWEQSCSALQHHICTIKVTWLSLPKATMGSTDGHIRPRVLTHNQNHLEKGKPLSNIMKMHLNLLPHNTENLLMQKEDLPFSQLWGEKEQCSLHYAQVPKFV